MGAALLCRAAPDPFGGLSMFCTRTRTCGDSRIARQTLPGNCPCCLERRRFRNWRWHAPAPCRVCLANGHKPRSANVGATYKRVRAAQGTRGPKQARTRAIVTDAPCGARPRQTPPRQTAGPGLGSPGCRDGHHGKVTDVLVRDESGVPVGQGGVAFPHHRPRPVLRRQVLHALCSLRRGSRVSGSGRRQEAAMQALPYVREQDP